MVKIAIHSDKLTGYEFKSNTFFFHILSFNLLMISIQACVLSMLTDYESLNDVDVQERTSTSMCFIKMRRNGCSEFNLEEISPILYEHFFPLLILLCILMDSLSCQTYIRNLRKCLELTSAKSDKFKSKCQ